MISTMGAVLLQDRQSFRSMEGSHKEQENDLFLCRNFCLLFVCWETSFPFSEELFSIIFH